MLTTVFVYGTLMPGHLRWGLLAPFATDRRPARTAGRIFDTGRGWPAARFLAPLATAAIADGAPVPPDSTIPGWLVDLAPAAAAALLHRLDEVEGAVLDDPPAIHASRPSRAVAEFRRVRIRAHDGTEAWSYEAVAVDASWVPVARWSDQPER